jgi:AraC-like DNA-binding protein
VRVPGGRRAHLVQPGQLRGLERERRAAFAERFTSFVGVPPMTYVGGLRMRRAGEPVGAVAQRSGYVSVAAFSRAFKQATGMTPSAVA